MIPDLTVDMEMVAKNWPPKAQRATLKIIENSCVLRGTDFQVHCFADFWVPMGVFKEFNKLAPVGDFYEYGYGDTEEAIGKYLRKYADDKENNYFVEVGLLDMDNEKYYKFGSYINKDGVDTEDDYYSYITNHPSMKVKQDFKGQWIRFSIRKLA